MGMRPFDIHDGTTTGSALNDDAPAGYFQISKELTRLFEHYENLNTHKLGLITQ